eukprot:SM000020S06008  [mRNA]  locus=s20:440118:441026:+ [translate_table: standard]
MTGACMHWRHRTRASMASGARTVASSSTGGTPPKTAPTPVAPTGRGDGPAAATMARTRPPVAWAGMFRTTTAKPCSLDPIDLLTWRTHCTQVPQLPYTRRLMDLFQLICEPAKGGNSCGQSEQQLNILNTLIITWKLLEAGVAQFSRKSCETLQRWRCTCKYGGPQVNSSNYLIDACLPRNGY